ncbi:hypothetical protein [Paraburkholderia fungorum]|nr:hypothetical protein [Paraburkholderia fungorum]
MGEQIKIWVGAAAIVAIYLLMCSVSDEHQANVERCSVVRCT